MASGNTVKDLRTASTANSQYNALRFMMESVISQRVNTADVVRVVSVEPSGPDGATGYVSVLPLVCQLDAFDNTLQPVELFKLPYSRIQGGVAALVIDPVPGDIGIAVYMKRDSSNVAQEQDDPVQPGSFRGFSQSDGFYIGGFLNQAPSIYLELDQNNNARLVAPESVRIETKSCTIDCETFSVNASVSAGINSPSWAFRGYDGSSAASGSITGDINQQGRIDSTGDHTANGVSLDQHVHSGVGRGSSNTDGPVR